MMISAAIKMIPNALTAMRMILALPIFWLILNERFSTVLWIAFIAGLSDGIDGWLARKLNVLSRFGEVADPLSDKFMLVSTYLAFAVVGLVPWWLTGIVMLRDLVIVSGAVAYHLLFGRYSMAPSLWGKLSTLVQILFALMMLAHQVYPVFPTFTLELGLWLVVVMAFISGGHYVYVWGNKALLKNKARKGS